MALQVAEISFEMIAAVRPLVARIRRQDRSLADQLVRAASSVALNIGEADVSWGYIPQADASESAALLRRIVAMLWKLARR
jgi:hypothetical protein